MITARAAWLVVCLIALAGLQSGASLLDRRAAALLPLDGYAERYLNLVAELQALDPDSVDFLLDRTAVRSRGVRTFAWVAEQSRALAAEVGATAPNTAEDAQRAASLARHLSALAFRSDQRGGKQVAFAHEMDHLFAIDASQLSGNAPDEDAVRQALTRLLPGTGALADRLSAYQRRFVVPRGSLHAVIARSLAACRRQTARFLALPEGEELIVEYVADRPWSGYSVYQGRFRSVMLVNRALPLSVGQALNLACHEGYPGHHTYNSVRDRHVFSRQNRPEVRALLTFSPEGFYAEALAAAAASIVFSVDERARLFREELFPLVGIDPREAAKYAEVCDLIERLAGATTPVIRRYLSGELSSDEAAAALERDALMKHPEGLLAYVDRYRGYALAYAWGRNRLLANLMAPELSESERWRKLEQLLTAALTGADGS